MENFLAVVLSWNYSCGLPWAYLFHQSDETWEQLPPVPKPADLGQALHGLHTASLLPDGRVILVGGVSPNIGSGALASSAASTIFDPATKTWSSGPSMHQGRGNHAAATLPDGRVLVVGGYGSGDDMLNRVALASAEILDPALATWTLFDANPRATQTSATRQDGSLLLVGGAPGAASAELLLFPSLESHVLEAPGGQRFYSTASLLNDGRVLVAGGASEPDTLEYVTPSSIVLDTSGFDPDAGGAGSSGTAGASGSGAGVADETTDGGCDCRAPARSREDWGKSLAMVLMLLGALRRWRSKVNNE